MKKSFRLILIMLFLLSSIGLFSINTEREFVSYTPQEGESGVVLGSDAAYRQTFVTERHSISRLTLFLRPLISELPPASFTVNLSTGDTVRKSTTVPASLVDRDGATQIKFPSPLPTTPGDTITLTIDIPASLHNLLRAQVVSAADNPDISDISFFVNDAQQPLPLAFQLFYDYRPPLSYQLAIYLIFICIWLASQRSLLHPAIITSYVIASVLAFLSPMILLTSINWFLAIAFVLAVGGMILLLRTYGLTPPSIFLGANAFGFSTYFALHAQSGRDLLLLFSLLPWLFLLSRPSIKSPLRFMSLAVLLCGLLIFLLLAHYRAPSVTPLLVANLKDILLDPNQIPTADKFQAAYYALQIPRGDPATILAAGGWDNFGSYLGYLNLPFALVGLLFYSKQSRGIALLGALGFLVAAFSPLTTLLVPSLWFPPQYLIILLSFALAFFSAFGLEKLRLFLGLHPVTTFIVSSLAVIALFDLLNVTSKTLQFGLL